MLRLLSGANGADVYEAPEEHAHDVSSSDREFVHSAESEPNKSRSSDAGKG